MRLRRLVWPTLVSALFLVVLFAAVFPTRTFLAQRASISRAEEQLDVLEEQNAALEARADQLRDDAEIERLAREQYNLVRPGEEAYALLPAPTPPPTAAPTEDAGAAPAEVVGPPAPVEDDRNVVQRAWDAVLSWF